MGTHRGGGGGGKWFATLIADERDVHGTARHTDY